MEAVSRALSSELFMSLALVLVPWGLARLFAWWRAERRVREDEVYAAAVEALEVGVGEAWERFGRAWKHAHADGKLTDEERERLRSVARETAVALGREDGLDVLKVLGERAIKTLIRKIVERRKRGA
jgi:hypothetical protein